MKGTRGGRVATVPDGRWAPPQRLLPGADTVQVRFVEESSGRPALFDFSRLPAEVGVCRWLAAAFARRVGPRSGVKRLPSAQAIYGMCRRFAVVLAQHNPPVTGPANVTPAHIAAFVLRYAGRPSGRADLIELRALLRDDPQLPTQTRTALLSARLPRASQADRTHVAAYDHREWQLIMTALRRDVRTARDRITAGRDLLARYRAGVLAADNPETAVGACLDAFDRTGDIARNDRGQPTRQVARAGGVAAVVSLLCLTVDEMAAFSLLLTALTGENFGTVAGWPAACHRPSGTTATNNDDDADPDRAAEAAVTLLEQVKPRRGPEREHMVTALEDLPRGLADLLGADEPDRRLFRSPARVYRLLIELTEASRRHGRHASAFSAYSTTRGQVIDGVDKTHIRMWARARGFPTAGTTGTDAAPALDVRRIRQTAIERTQRPVSHTRATMNDYYLARSANVSDESRVVTADALRDQLAKGRTAQEVPVFTAATLARCETDPDSVATEYDLDTPAMRRMLAGEQDTAVVACADHLAGPHTQPGQPCTASFLACLNCGNARALPHHLPAQLAMAERITALRPHLDPAVWQARYETPLRQLQHIFGCYTTAEYNQARDKISEQHRALIDDVLAGNWDLR